MDDNYCFINKNSISKEICNEIIQLFENSKHKHDGATAGGVNKNVKDTTDLVIDKNDSEWKEIYTLLENELQRNTRRYVEKANNNNKDLKEFKRFQGSLSFETIQVQKYVKNTGKYIYHEDGRVFPTDHAFEQFRIKKYNPGGEDRFDTHVDVIDHSTARRYLAFLWYLNDITDGGETEFQDFKVRPEAGKLILFPALWTYPHRGNVPISDDKYIMTGWLDEKIHIANKR